MAIDIQLQEVLIDAIREDSAQALIEEVKNGLNINEYLSNGDSLLHVAFHCKKYQIIQHLILLGASLMAENVSKKTPLHIAASNDFFEGAKLHVSLGLDLNLQDHKGRVPLMYAIKYRHKALVKMLMGKGTDTSLEDNNGYSSLLWAIKYFNPEELKEIFSDTSKEELQQAIEQQSLEDKKVEVANETIEHLNENDEDDIITVAIEEIPNPLKELLSKKQNEEDLIPYSITDHIESLKNKNDDDIFDYDIHENIGKNKKEEFGEDIYAHEEETKQTHEQEDIITEFTEDQEGTASETVESLRSERQNSKLEPHKSDQISISSSPREKEKEPVQGVASTEPDIIPHKNESINISGKESEQDNEIQKIKKLDDIENIPHEANEKESRDKIPSSISDKDEELKAQVVKGSNNEIEREEVKRVAGKSDFIETASWSTKSDKKESLEEQLAYQKQEIKRVLHPEKIQENAYERRSKNEPSSDQKKENITHKKNITYLKDGYKEVYNEQYGEIRKVDKNISNDELGDITKTDKHIAGEELEEIKNVNKSVQGEYEVQYIEGSKVEKVDATNLEGKISYEEVDQYDINSTEVKTLDQGSLKRADRSLAKTTEEVFQGTIPTDKVTDEVLGVAKGSDKTNPELGNIQFKHLEIPTQKNLEKNSQDNDELETQKKAFVEEQATNDEHEEIDNDPSLSEQEKKLLKTIEDADQKNKKGQSLCWLAAFNGQVELLKKLIHKGGNYEIKDPQGISPLMAACMKGHLNVVEYLVHKVRNVDEKRRDGQTAVSLSIQYDRDEVLRILFDNGASSEMKIKGNTLLMHAAEHDATKSISVLIMLGADPLEKNIRGKTALDVAKQKKKKRAYMTLNKIIKARILNQVSEDE